MDRIKELISKMTLEREGQVSARALITGIRKKSND